MMVTRVVAALTIGLALIASGPMALATEAGEAEGKLNPVAPPYATDLAIWTAAVFLVLLLVLWRFAWRPLAEGLDRRERGIAEQIAQAEAAHRAAQELLAQYEQKLAESQQEVRAILDQARRDAERAGRELLEKTKQEARAERDRAVQQIEAAAVAAMKELAQRGADLAVRLAGRIVRAKLKPQDHAQLIEQAVAEFTRQKPGIKAGARS